MDFIELLSVGLMDSLQLMPTGSNYVFMVTITGGNGDQCRAVYKPQAGEAPLSDFPDGTLYAREYGSYLLSEACEWGFVPPTVIREGPYGIGSVQLMIQPRGGTSYFTLRETHAATLQKIVVFDYLANNADRKAGHCFEDREGKVWSIDHGLTFHPDDKLRSVIWDWAGQSVPEPIVRELANLAGSLPQLESALASCVTESESRAFRVRLDQLIEDPIFPVPRPNWRNTPWPLF